MTTLALGPVEDAVLTAVRAVMTGKVFAVDFTQTKKAVPVFHGLADPKSVPPYVLVGDSSNAQKLNTLGPAYDDNRAQSNLGATCHVPLRVVTSYPTTQEQAYRILEPMHAALNGKRLMIAGYGRSVVTFENTLLLSSVVGGITQREIFNELDVTVHQSS